MVLIKKSVLIRVIRGAINTHQNYSIMEKKEIWSKILNIVITVLTAIATTFGVTSCMGV